jgi:hypothetical protein
MKHARTLTVLLLTLMACLAMTAPSWAQTYGGTGVLKIKPGARATGMGQAGVAVYQRAHSMWWNPAQLAQSDGKEFSSTLAKLVPDLADDVYYLNLAYGQHLEGWGGLGIEVMYLSYGKTEAVDEEGTSYGYFSSYEFVPTIGFGTRLIGGPEGAASGNKDGKADAFAVDIGGLMGGAFPIPNFGGDPLAYAIGANVQNLGSKLVYIDADQGDPLPRNLKVGIALDLLSSESFGIIGSFDYNKALIEYGDTDRQEQVDKFGWGNAERLLNAGIEFTMRDLLSFRTGYVDDPEGEIESWTFGAGLDVSFSGGTKLIRFDYSSVPQALDLDRVSYLSVGVLFL